MNAPGAFEEPAILYLRILDAGFAIRCHDPRWVDFLSELWKPFFARVAPPDCLEYQVMVDPLGWRVRFFAGYENLGGDPWALATGIRNTMIHAALKATPRVIGLHAAVLSFQGMTVLFAGTSGVGKSTLALHLVSQGWTYFSDDLAPIEKSSGRILSFPKPLNIKTTISSEITRMWQPPAWLPPPSSSFLLPASLLRLDPRAAVKPDLLFFIRHDAPNEPTHRRLTSGQALAAAASSLLIPSVEPGSMAILKRLVGTVQSAEITYRNSEEAATLIYQSMNAR